MQLGIVVLNPIHSTDDIVSDRYRIVAPIGQGSTGTTYEAEDLNTYQRVALKVMSFRGMRDWKQLELFEREAEVLSYLEHPGIPKYLDYFQIDSEGDRIFYIVQALAPGQSLARLIEAGWRPTQDEVKRLARNVLNILIYLHRLTPPIIHRDIKPQNIIRAQDGQIYLVDFGAVQSIFRNTTAHGSTIVGTYGYMAPEQFRGQAYWGTDLYGLGATLLFLLTHRHPGDLPQQRLKVAFRKYLKHQIEPGFADWLDQMIEPLLEDRFTTAQIALKALDQVSQPVAEPITQSKALVQASQPSTETITQSKALAGSNIRLQRTRTHLTIEIRPNRSPGQSLIYALCSEICSKPWLILVVLWMFSIFSVISPVPLWGIGFGLAVLLLYRVIGCIHLEINAERFRLQWQFFKLRKQIEGRTCDLSGVELLTVGHINNQPVRICNLIENGRAHGFGLIICDREKEWLAQEIETFLRQLPSA